LKSRYPKISDDRISPAPVNTVASRHYIHTHTRARARAHIYVYDIY